METILKGYNPAGEQIVERRHWNFDLDEIDSILASWNRRYPDVVRVIIDIAL